MTAEVCSKIGVRERLERPIYRISFAHGFTSMVLFPGFIFHHVFPSQNIINRKYIVYPASIKMESETRKEER